MSPEQRADAWFGGASMDAAGIIFLGAPTSTLSLSPSRADTTPAELRRVMSRFATWDASLRVDVAGLPCHDAGDVDMQGDPLSARGRHEDRVAALTAGGRPLILCGGDNSITYSGVRGLARAAGASLSSGAVALITFDAHHDLRPPSPRPSNGSPVRELLTDGLPGASIFQLGIGRHANSRSLGETAAAAGITVFTSDQLASRGWPATVAEVLARVEAEHIYLDVDMDVLDRAFAPACPASMPGGASPGDLVEAVALVARDPRLRAVDVVEVDAQADIADTTLRAACAVVLAAAAGIASRPG